MQKPEFSLTLLLIFFAFLGGLTRELNDLVSNKLNIKNFIIGITTAITTGVILGKILIGLNVNEELACGLAGLAGFIGPHILLVVSTAFEKKVEQVIISTNKKGE